MSNISINALDTYKPESIGVINNVTYGCSMDVDFVNGNEEVVVSLHIIITNTVDENH
jgi:hypothetical protein